jgi:hypothetical protein
MPSGANVIALSFPKAAKANYYKRDGGSTIFCWRKPALDHDLSQGGQNVALEQVQL